jgi:2-iminoacetate synthase
MPIINIIKKAEEKKGLSINQVKALLSAPQDKKELIFKAANKIKQEIYGNRLVLFAPLYISNTCINDCLYCGFKKSNQDIDRITLSLEQIKEETINILKQGHKRILLVAGENNSDNFIDYIISAINTIYETKYNNDSIKRINVNLAPLTNKQFKKLKKANIGTYQLFQETYDINTYKTMHPTGPKSNYANRLDAINRAIESGIDDVGIGVLFGLHNYKEEVISLLKHIKNLEKKHGIGPHTISVPRLEPAHGSKISTEHPCPVSDEELKMIIAILRLAVPYTGIILSTRESTSFRNEAIELGVSQISAASKTNPGGYSNKKAAEQFSVHDNRSLDQVISACIDKNYMPSFCTSCYRVGRTGHEFMDYAKDGSIKDLCKLNAILTFKEYLLRFASPQTQEKGEQILLKEINKLNDAEKKLITENLNKINQGKTDICL